MSDIVIDGDFSFPVELADSPLISTDEITGARLISRRFAQLKAEYVPLPQGNKDEIYTDAYLINEQVDSTYGVLTWFSRIYAEKPDSRVEPISVTFTMPGRSSIDVSFITGKFINWNPYGAAAPYSRPVTAECTYSYEINPMFGFDGITFVSFNGAPVDFVGEVWKFIGNETIVDPSGNTITEQRWQLQGSTFPGFVPGIWVMENSIQRWRGPIWERRVIRVYTGLLTLP